jgi:Zn-dependent protease with chaperone function
LAQLLLSCLAGSLPILVRTIALAAQTASTLPLTIASTLPSAHTASSTELKAAEALVASTTRVQTIVDDVRARLSIPQEVVVSIVAQDKLLVSVERLQSRDGAFTLAFQGDFLDVLSEEEITAVVAHELGHVWIFTHHPYLQTEELANKVALRLISRDTLEKVYAKVWQRTGGQGDLAYLPTK